MSPLKSFIFQSSFLAFSIQCSATAPDQQEEPKSFSGSAFQYSEELPPVIFDLHKLKNSDIYFYPFNMYLGPSPNSIFSGNIQTLLFNNFVTCRFVRTIYFSGMEPTILTKHDENIVFAQFRKKEIVKKKFDTKLLQLKLETTTYNEETRTHAIYEAIIQFSLKLKSPENTP
jgi:cell division protein FtsL